MKLVVASNNPGKLREFGALLAPLGWETLPQQALGVSECEEPHGTFVENALAKARHASAATGLPALADDSGLCVDALSGAPGVYSARYAGENATDAANNDKLLTVMAHVPEGDRTCRFVSVVVAADPDGRELTAEGSWEGRVAFAPAGDGGFGYDPLFFDARAGKTAAELTPAEKNARSHRGNALRALLAKWQDFMGA